MQLQVIDNFFEDPAKEREQALEATYQTIEHNTLKYRGISFVEDAAAVSKIEKLTGSKLEARVMYRRYLENEENETYIHSDVDIGTYTAIAFLNPPEQCFGGTAFWRHRQHKWIGQPKTPEEILEGHGEDTLEFWAKIYRDGFDESKWIMRRCVPMRYNRLIIFPSHWFHSRYPKKAFGTEIGNSRLIKVFFCKA